MGACDFQHLLTKLFLPKGCFELPADSEQGESSTHSAGAGRGAHKGQPRVHFPEKRFLLRVPKSWLETLLLKKVFMCSAVVVVVCHRVHPQHTPEQLPQHIRGSDQAPEGGRISAGLLLILRLGGDGLPACRRCVLGSTHIIK